MASYIWDGTVDTSLDNPLNYSPNGIPTTGDDVFFPDAPTNRVESGTLVCDSIIFNTLAEIWGGDFTGVPSVISWGQVHGGIFPTGFENNNIVHELAIFTGTFHNNGFIFDSDFSLVTLMNNNYNIYGGTYPSTCVVVNTNTLTDGIFNGTVNSSNSIVGGTFNGYVDLSGGNVAGGTFNGEVLIESGASTSGGTYNSKVTNLGNISDGIFNDLVENELEIYSGTFNGDFWNKSTATYAYGDFTNIDRIKLNNSPWFDLPKGINGTGIVGML